MYVFTLTGKLNLLATRNTRSPQRILNMHCLNRKQEIILEGKNKGGKNTTFF